MRQADIIEGLIGLKKLRRYKAIPPQWETPPHIHSPEAFTPEQDTIKTHTYKHTKIVKHCKQIMVQFQIQGFFFFFLLKKGWGH